MENSVPELSSATNFTQSELNYFNEVARHFDDTPGSSMDKLGAFPRFVPRQTLATLLTRHHIFKKVLKIHGHVVECGVFRGAGLFTWANLSSIYEPYNHTRRIIGFDTFGGFPRIGDEDQSHEGPEYKIKGGLAADGLSSIEQSVDIYNLNRFISHIPRIELVAGDASTTIPQFRNSNRHLVVALLYLDFDLYEPTRIAIQTFWPLMPKGSVIAFDELNQAQWPGETEALINEIGIGAIKLERLSIHPQISFAVKH